MAAGGLFITLNLNRWWLLIVAIVLLQSALASMSLGAGLLLDYTGNKCKFELNRSRSATARCRTFSTHGYKCLRHIRLQLRPGTPRDGQVLRYLLRRRVGRD